MAIGDEQLGFAPPAGIEDDLTRRRIAGIVLEADAEIHVAERNPPATMYVDFNDHPISVKDIMLTEAVRLIAVPASPWICRHAG